MSPQFNKDKNLTLKKLDSQLNLVKPYKSDLNLPVINETITSKY